jgi:hypothetical protein
MRSRKDARFFAWRGFKAEVLRKLRFGSQREFRPKEDSAIMAVRWRIKGNG